MSYSKNNNTLTTHFSKITGTKCIVGNLRGTDKRRHFKLVCQAGTVGRVEEHKTIDTILLCNSIEMFVQLNDIVFVLLSCNNNNNMFYM